MDNASNRGRNNGVLIPRGQTALPSNAPPGSIIGFQPVEIFAVRYVGEDGKEVDELFQRMAGQWYRAPNGINYAAGLKKLREDGKLAKFLTDQYKSKIAPKKVPETDGADILADGP